LSDANYIQEKSNCGPIRNSKNKSNCFHPYLKVAQATSPAHPDIETAQKKNILEENCCPICLDSIQEVFKSFI